MEIVTPQGRRVVSVAIDHHPIMYGAPSSELTVTVLGLRASVTGFYSWLVKVSRVGAAEEDRVLLYPMRRALAKALDVCVLREPETFIETSKLGTDP